MWCSRELMNLTKGWTRKWGHWSGQGDGSQAEDSSRNTWLNEHVSIRARESDAQTEVISLALCYVWLTPSFQRVFLFVWIKPVASRRWEGAPKRTIDLLEKIPWLDAPGGTSTVPAVVYINEPSLWNSVLHLKEERKKRKRKGKKGAKKIKKKKKKEKKGKESFV